MRNWHRPDWITGALADRSWKWTKTTIIIIQHMSAHSWYGICVHRLWKRRKRQRLFQRRLWELCAYAFWHCWWGSMLQLKLMLTVQTDTGRQLDEVRWTGEMERNPEAAVPKSLLMGRWVTWVYVRVCEWVSRRLMDSLSLRRQWI